ncbi:hypothetical protein AOB60_00745 [Streptomyces noursei]|uniref:Uncharacterized protein n=1 Tax=Streptomyces noursei TaxID=1971 RepID=A0A2N8PR71_STRNR|nr:hypothetical protein AOB60_00745 [Streptomyces noursei]
MALERLAGVLENAIRDAIGNGILLAPKFPCRDCKTPSGIHVRRLVQPVVSDRLADVIERGIHTRLLHGGRIRPPYCDFEFP